MDAGEAVEVVVGTLDCVVAVLGFVESEVRERVVDTDDWNDVDAVLNVEVHEGVVGLY